MQFLALLLSLAATQSGAPSACLDVSAQRDTPLTLVGRLDRHVYPGPPNYGEGPNDRRETAYILTLDRSICIEDGDNFADPAEQFRQVHLFTLRASLWPRLRAAIGRRIRVSGAGFAAHTAHHRAPLVVDVRTLRVEGR